MSHRWGVFSEEAAAKVDKAVRETQKALKNGELKDDDALVEFVKSRLRPIGDGATDTVVKESVFGHLRPDIQAAGIVLDRIKIYGW